MSADACDGAPLSTPPAARGAQDGVPGSSAPVDPLVARAAGRIADALNGLKRELDTRDRVRARIRGALQIQSGDAPAQSFALTVVPGPGGDEHPVVVRAAATPGTSTDGAQQSNRTGSSTVSRPRLPRTGTSKTTPRGSDAELDGDIVWRKRRRTGEEATTDATGKRSCPADEAEDVVALVTKQDLEKLFAQLCEDVEEDPAACVNHVQRLLRRFKQQWEAQTESRTQPNGLPSRPPAVHLVPSTADTTPGDAFPSADPPSPPSSVPTLIRSESKLISSQIRWVEDCRRVASDIHDKREETWRVTSASFHDRQRQDREAFQARLLQETSVQNQTLNQILNEVKAIGLYAQNMKWETPSSHLLAQSPAYPAAPPPFPQAPPPMPEATTAPARGAGRGRAVSPPKPASQR